MKLVRLALYMGMIFFSTAAYTAPLSKTDLTLHNVGAVLHLRALVRESENPKETINGLEADRIYFYKFASKQLDKLIELEMLVENNLGSVDQGDLHTLEAEIKKFALLKELYGRNSPSALELQKLCREYGLPEFSNQPPLGIHRPKPQ